MRRFWILFLLFLSCCSSDKIPKGPEGDLIRQGREIATHTVIKAKGYSGNGLNCTSCHINAGTKPNASPWIGVPGTYPKYSDRYGKVLTLRERINDCFSRSMNGKPVPEDGPEMKALIAYMDWLSRNVPKGTLLKQSGLESLKAPGPADAARGATLYVARKCESCHGPEGQGVFMDNGEPFYPPLWGNKSFNDGAGMNILDKAAAFIHANMPQDNGDTLPVQDAYDIAAFVISHPRPHFSQ